MPPDSNTSKVCTKCGEEKPLTEFSVDRQKKDGLCSDCKECRSAQSAAWYAANRERRLAVGRAWKKANPEKVAAHLAAWRAAHPEKAAATRAAYREANRERLEDYRRAQYKANRKIERAQNRAWQKNNPERIAANARNYYARKIGAPGTHTAEDIQAQYDAQKGRCRWCGDKVGDDYHVDHVVPLSRGGSNWPSNLVIACPSCNAGKSNKHPIEYAGVMF